ncbi:MAG: thioredoxin domain-containing protein [Desulfobacterales bacterium]
MPTNRLINEKSPYLLQHAHNPVDWYPWADDTFAHARLENKPIFLSIGYATCHWCHVMEKETFEDEEAARYLNDTFVCIKVDREERPDIDAVYMAACQMVTGSGGWPLTIFMTPDKKPFFAATYLPKLTRFGRAGVVELCRQVGSIWQKEVDKVLASADQLVEHLGRAFEFQPAGDPDASLIDRAYDQIKKGYDGRHGGFEPAPKFPTPHRLLFLLRCYLRHEDPLALEMVEKTLTAMRLGGIWDHVGHGFHRYSTDSEWLVPHFEKMLYDQALVALPYLETYQITRNPFYARTVAEIFTYVLRDMQSPEGGFYSAEDADSEGEEGRFYVWTAAEFGSVLGAQDAAVWSRVFNLEEGGNFLDESTRSRTGANILNLKHPPEQVAADIGAAGEDLLEKWEPVREKLFQHREKRVHPLKDDKVLTDWNGMMIAALARGARILDRPQFKDAAVRAARFVLEKLRGAEGRLFHRYREGEVAIDGHAEDYAFLIFGLLELYRTTFDPLYLKESLALQKQMLEDFRDDRNGGFYTTSSANRELPVRPKELYDGAIPSVNSMALYNFLCLSRLTGDAKWEEEAQALARSFSGSISAQPSAFTFFLVGLDFALNPGEDVVIAGKPEAADTLEMLSAINFNFSPRGITLVKSDKNAKELAWVAGFTDKLAVVDGKTTAYICKGGSCRESTSDVAALLEKLTQK